MLSDREGFTQVPRFILSGGPDGTRLYCDYNQYTGIRREDSSMYEIRQLDIPASFMELYSRNGRAPESREFVEARFDTCDELAHGVSEFLLLSVKSANSVSKIREWRNHIKSLIPKCKC